MPFASNRRREELLLGTQPFLRLDAHGLQQPFSARRFGTEAVSTTTVGCDAPEFPRSSTPPSDNPWPPHRCRGAAAAGTTGREQEFGSRLRTSGTPACVEASPVWPSGASSNAGKQASHLDLVATIKRRSQVCAPLVRLSFGSAVENQAGHGRGSSRRRRSRVCRRLRAVQLRRNSPQRSCLWREMS